MKQKVKKIIELFILIFTPLILMSVAPIKALSDNLSNKNNKIEQVTIAPFKYLEGYNEITAKEFQLFYNKYELETSDLMLGRFWVSFDYEKDFFDYRSMANQTQSQQLCNMREDAYASPKLFDDFQLKLTYKYCFNNHVYYVKKIGDSKKLINNTKNRRAEISDLFARLTNNEISIKEYDFEREIVNNKYEKQKNMLTHYFIKTVE